MEADFECRACSKLFNGAWFDISRTVERVHFSGAGELDEVEIADGEGIAAHCSRFCHTLGREPVMLEEGVPIPSVRPGIGPIETCAQCSGPVDMADWHVTFTEGRMQEQAGAISVLEFEYVAVVCKHCMPVDGSGSAAAEMSEAQNEQEAKVSAVETART